MRRRRLLLLATSAGLTLLSARPSAACTTFLAQHDGQPVFGRNYDWDTGAGLVVVNMRGPTKTAVAFSPENATLNWTAKYASITFNQYGVELPTGGMNEAGLVVEQMWLDSTMYPAADTRPTVNELQWIQYALDGFSNVDEFANAAQQIRLSPVYAKVHYLVCDIDSNCAAFEYIAGKLVMTRGADLRVKVLANDSYAESLAYLDQFVGFGGTTPIPTSESSLDRFARAASMAQTTAGTTIPTTAFGILDAVAQSQGWTKWSIVYAPKQGTVYFRTHATPKVKSVRFDAFALSCPNQRKILDIDADLAGDVSSQFTEYSLATNRALVARTLGALPLPSTVVDLVAAYPDTLTCPQATNPNPGVGGAAGAPSVQSVAGAAGAPTSGSLGSNQGVAGSGAPRNSAEGGSRALATWSANGGADGSSRPSSTNDSSAAQPGDHSDSGCSIARQSHSERIASYLSVLGLALLARRRRAEQTK